MKSAVASLALFALAAFAQSNFTINTPTNVVACEPTLLNWMGGTPPYFLSVLPGASPSGSPIETLPTQNGTSFTWTCNISPGSYIGFTLRDNNGQVAQTAPVTVITGASNSCVNITAAGGGPTSAASTPIASNSGSAATTTHGASASSAGSSGSSAPAATSSTSSTGGASANAAQLGVAGLVGVAAAAFFL